MDVNNNFVGFFYAVATKEKPQKIKGYLFGTVHQIPPEEKNILELNEKINKIFQSTTYYLTENYSVFDEQTLNTIGLLIETTFDYCLCEYLNVNNIKNSDEIMGIFKKSLQKQSESLKAYGNLDTSLVMKALELNNQEKSKKKFENLEDIHLHISQLLDCTERKMCKKNLDKYFLGGKDINEETIHKFMEHEDAKIIKETLNHWKQGDGHALATYSAENAYFSERKFTLRNIHMTDSIDILIKNKLKKKQTFFAFPGALHLLKFKGERGILARLEEKGYVLTRL